MHKEILSLVVFLLFCTTSATAQERQDTSVQRNGNGYVLWLLPSRKDNIYGVALGIFGSEVICDMPINIKRTHGVNIQIIGQGLFIPLNTKTFGYKSLFASDTAWMVRFRDSKNYRAINNGILLSGFGTMTDVSNGIVVSGWFSLGKQANGLILNALANKYTIMNGIAISVSNESYEANGIQIGLVNRTRKLCGFQFGLWNVNGKRKLPLINWCFRP